MSHYNTVKVPVTVKVKIVAPSGLVVFVLVPGETDTLEDAPAGALITTIPDPPLPPQPA
jgi:hypothetical protein